MTTTVSQAIYEAQVRGKEQLDALAKSLGVVATAEEKVTSTTAATSKGFDNLVSKLDPAIKANQQYQATLERLARYESAGIGSAQQRGVALALAQQKYQDAVGKSVVANDNLRQSAMAAQGVLSQLGLNIPIVGAAGPIALVGAALATLAVGTIKAVNAFDKFEAQAFVLDAVLKSTGFSAGRTATQIQALVDDIGDISKTRDAAAVLLTFKSVAVDTFDRTLRLADDLAAVMKTDVSSAALQLGKALEDPEKGLSALTRSGVSFSSQQKQVIKDLFETGQTAQAQGLILDQVAKQVGGAGAAKDAGLAGSYEALSDATQRLLEHWGQQIARGLNLTNVIKGIAGAIDDVTKRANDPSFKNAADLARVQGTLSALEGRGGSIAAQARRKAEQELNTLLAQQAKLRQEADAAGDTADRGAAFAEYERRKEAYDSVVVSIQKETSELRKSDLQKAIDINLRKAQVDASSAQGAEIIRLTTLKQREADAIKSSTNAAKEAEALSKKQTEGLRRFNEELDSRMTKLAAERAGIGLSTEAALTLKTVEDDLAKLREKGIPVSAAQEQNIRNRAEEYAKERIAVNELKAEYDNLNNAINGFGQNLVSSLIQGKSVMESMTGAATQLTSKLASATLNRLQNGGSLFGNQQLGSVGGAVGMASAGLSGYQSASPLGGALGGAMAGAAFGPAGMAIGGAVGLIGGLMGKADKAKKEMEEARDAWAKMAGEVRKFTDEMTGTNTGALGGAITDATEKAQKYADAAHKAGEASTALNAALIVFVQRVTRDFIVSFDVMIEALNQGLGADSPAVKAGQNMKQLGDTLKAFIDDTTKAGQGLAQARPAIAAAREASQQYALSLLQVTPALSETQSAILTLRGTAAQLQTTLQDLGMSANDAGQAIASGIGTAMDGIADKLTDGLNRQMNDASGKGYINQLDDLVKATIGNLTDADLTGVDTSLVAKLFMQQAQGIIDDAGLVGDAFTDLTSIFPELNGVLGESQKALTDFSKNIDDFLNGLKIGDLSTLSPEQQLAAAQATYQSTLAGARSGDVGSQGKVTDAANTLLTVAKSYFASSGGYSNIFAQVTGELSSLSDIAKSSADTSAALSNVDENTGQTGVNTSQTAKSLAALRGIQSQTAQSSVDISDAVQRLGEQGDYTANGQNSIYFGPMRDYLAAIEANTRLAGEAADQGPGGADAWYEDWFSKGGIVGRHATGGIIGAYAPGGIVGNGMFGRDSVLARYAGGGAIALAGREGILTSKATQAIGGAQMIDFINRNDRLPEAMMPAPTLSSASVVMPANDNRGRDDNRRNSLEVGRMISAAVAAQTETLRGELAALRQEFSRQTATIRQESNRKVVAAGKK